jgi:hypothetical protein
MLHFLVYTFHLFINVTIVTNMVNIKLIFLLIAICGHCSAHNAHCYDICYNTQNVCSGTCMNQFERCVSINTNGNSAIHLHEECKTYIQKCEFDCDLKMSYHCRKICSTMFFMI